MQAHADAANRTARTPTGTRLRRRGRRRNGSELLELSIVGFPILLLMLFGTIEFGTYFYVEHNLCAAAREGARAGVVAPPDQRDAAIAAAVDHAFEGSSLTEMNGFSYDAPIVEIEDDYLRVTVRTTWDRVPEGLRPMRMIRKSDDVNNPRADLVELKGFAAMRIENNTLPQ